MADAHWRQGENPPLEQGVLDYLAGRSTLSLSVTDAGGPWAAAVFFAGRGFELYFVSATTSRHGAALLEDPRCAATVQEQPVEVAAIRGVQLAGRATLVADGEVADAFAVYAAKFPFVRGLYRPEEGAYVIRGRRIEQPFWKLVAHDVYWIDNAYGFGARRHIRLGTDY